MTDQKRASQLAGEGLALWGKSELELAAQKTEEAINLADQGHWAVPNYHGQLAGIYAQAGQNDKARIHYKQALLLQLQDGGTEGSITIVTSRYFLAMHLLDMNLASEALGALQPSLQAAPVHWLNCNAHAHILHALSRFAEAKAAAQLAIENAPSTEKAEQLAENMKAMLADA